MTSIDVNSKIGRFKMVDLLGQGSFSKVYLAATENGELVAIKIERDQLYSKRLLREHQAYDALQGGIGIPRVHWFGNEEGFTVLALDVLGPSLDELFERCSRQFSLKTILMLADQLISRLEFMHSKYYLHRDVKPANFVIGTGEFSDNVYAIDFGLSCRYCDNKKNHVPNRSRYGIGTPLFSSGNIHCRMTPSRRDDMESLAYMLIYFLKGTLPWESIRGEKVASTWELIAKKKLATSADKLCEGCPEEFGIFLRHCKQLEYEEAPHYQYIRMLFRVLAQKLKYQYDWQFDWLNCTKEVVETTENSSNFKVETAPIISSKQNSSDEVPKSNKKLKSNPIYIGKQE